MLSPKNESRIETSIQNSSQMQQMLKVLQMNQKELEEWVAQEIEKNPLLEMDLPLLSKEEKEALQVPYTPSFQQHLLIQAKSGFSDPLHWEIAQTIIGSLTKEGFFVEEIKTFAREFHFLEKPVETVLKVLKTLDPIGSFAKDLQECLLFQLKEKKLENSLSYQIIEKCFSPLFQGGFSVIEKKFRLSRKELLSLIKREIKPLCFSPASSFSSSFSSPLWIDLQVKQGKKVEYKKPLTLISWKKEYFYLKGLPKEEKQQFSSFRARGNFLVKALAKRKVTLEKIGSYIVEAQQDFLYENRELKPLSIKQIAKELKMHPSTISRAIQEKTLETEKGLFFLKDLLSSALPKSEHYSEKRAKEKLRELLKKEDKKKPFSDEALCKKMREEGLFLSRRTISKYRLNLKIPSQNTRKLLSEIEHN